MSNETVVMVFSGEYDLASQQQVRRAFDSLAPASRAVLDFTAVTYVDSTVLSELVRLNALRLEGGLETVTLATANSNIRRLLSLVQLTDVLRVVDSLEDAVTSNGTAPKVMYADAYS
jgi:anti-anti-sigma factor